MKAILLYKTDETIDCDKTNIREQIDDIFDDPNNYVVKEFTNEESMQKLIYDALEKPTVGVTACNIWEDRDVVYVGYYIDIAETLNYGSVDDSEDTITDKIKESYSKTQLNIFGSQLTGQHVTHNLVILKMNLEYEVTNNNIKTSMKASSLDLTELKNVIEGKFIKNGIVIDTNGDISLYKYIMNPLEQFILTDNNYKDNYIYHEYEVYSHIIMVIVDAREINGVVNTDASLLSGGLIKGRVFVAMYKKPEFNELPPYVSLTIDCFKKILEIRKKSVTLTTGMSCSDKEYINLYKLLELECSKHSNLSNKIIDDISGICLNKKSD